MQFKLIYLARRNPAISEEDWPRAWRSHSRFIGQFPSIGAAVESLFYCGRIYRPMLDGAPFEPAGATRDYDGVALVAAESRATLSGKLSAEDRARIDEDERRVFSTSAPEFSFYCQESLVYGGAPGQAAVIRFLVREPGSTAEAFAERWSRSHAHIATRAAGLAGTVLRYVHNSTIEPPPPGYPFDGVAETWFANGEEAARSFADGPFAEIEQDLADFCDMDRSVTMLTDVVYRWPKA